MGSLPKPDDILDEFRWQFREFQAGRLPDDYIDLRICMMFGGQLQNCVTSLKEMGHDWTQRLFNSRRRTLSTDNECLLLAESGHRDRV